MAADRVIVLDRVCAVSRWSRARAAVLATVVLICGLFASAAVGIVLRSTQREHAEERMTQATVAVQGAVADQMRRYVDAVRGTAASLGSHNEVDMSRFVRITRPLADQQLSGATAVTFTAPVATRNTAAGQAYWRARGADRLTLQPVGTGDEHVYTIFSRGLGGNPPTPRGLDAAAAPTALAAFIRARQTDGVVVSDAYVLLRDSALPAARRQLSFVVVAPVFGPDRTLHGYLSLALRSTDFMTATLDRATGGTLGARLLTTTDDGTLVEVAAVRPPGGRRPALSRDVTVTAGQQHWTIHTVADDRTLLGAAVPSDLLASVAGVLLSFLVALVVHLQATGRRRAEDAVYAATVELREAESAARTQAALLSSVMTSIDDGVCVVGEDGSLLLQNPAAAERFAVAELPTSPVYRPHGFGYYRPDGITPFPADELPLARALAGEPADDVMMVVRNPRRPDGIVVAVTTRPLDASAGRPGAVAVFRDVTDRTRTDRELAAASAELRVELAQRTAAQAELRLARDELAEQKAYLTQVLDALQIAVVTCDNDGRVVHANRLARSALPAAAQTPTVADCARILQMVNPDGTAADYEDLVLRRALDGEVVDGQEFVVQYRGRSATVLAHARPLRHDAGYVTGAVTSLYDITALREREADLAAFAGVVAHDLNSPLAAIGGYSELLADELHAALPSPQGDDARRYLERLRGTVDRMRQLIEDLLAYTAAGDAKLNLTTVDLRHVVDEVVAARLEAAPGATSPPDVYIGALPAIEADASMVRQLVDNLVGNALKYTPPGQPARIDITAHPDADPGRVRIEIADRGIGIPDGHHHAIFADFHRAHHDAGYTGTGLGLAICFRVVQRHGGVIGVSDNPGGGARFHFTLPLGSGSTAPRAATRVGRTAGTRP